MRSTAVALSVALLIAVPMPAVAQGGPPLITDDPDTPGPGFWEINIAAQLEATDRERRADTPRVDINYGVGERIQLKFEAPWVRLQNLNEDITATGIGDANAGIKWRFLGGEGMRVAWSVYPQVEFSMTRSSLTRALDDVGPDLQLPTEITLELRGVEINVEAGRNFIRGSEGDWIVGLSTEVHATPRLELLAELHAQATRRKPSEIIANIGARPKLTRQITLLLSGGRTAGAGEDGEARAFLYAGLQFNLPGRYVPASPPGASSR